MRYARIGLLSFGGPAEQIAVMHRILVEEQHWIGEERFLPALNYCRLLPGPKAQQSARLVGWLLQRTLGGVVADALFVLPGFLAMLCVSVTYVLACDVPAVQALFYGLHWHLSRRGSPPPPGVRYAARRRVTLR